MSEETQQKVLRPNWSISEPIRLDDVCILESTGQEYLCSKIIPHGQFDYLYFGSFDFKNILFAVQCRQNEKNYVKVLSRKTEQECAFKFYKEVQ